MGILKYRIWAERYYRYLIVAAILKWFTVFEILYSKVPDSNRARGMWGSRQWPVGGFLQVTRFPRPSDCLGLGINPSNDAGTFFQRTSSQRFLKIIFLSLSYCYSLESSCWVRSYDGIWSKSPMPKSPFTRSPFTKRPMLKRALFIGNQLGLVSVYTSVKSDKKVRIGLKWCHLSLDGFWT